MGKPSFIGIGVMRSGSTYLYSAICRHPDIEKSTQKELHFFDNKFRYGYKWYENQFPDNCVTGELSGYMFHPFIAYEIKRKYPDVVTIAILRNPVTRALSHYHHCINNKRQDKRESFADALKKELNIRSYKDYKPGVKNTNLFINALPYLAKGIYANYVSIWKTLFGKKCIFIKAEDFFKNPQKDLDKIYNALGVRPYKISTKGLWKNDRKYPPMSRKTKRFLEDFYKIPNATLKKMVGITW